MLSGEMDAIDLMNMDEDFKLRLERSGERFICHIDCRFHTIDDAFTTNSEFYREKVIGMRAELTDFYRAFT